jgi:hypothetical protein
MTDLEQRLAAHLDSWSDGLDVVNAPVGGLIKSAKRRQFRRRRTAVAASSVMLVGATIGAVSLRPFEEAGLTTVGPGTEEIPAVVGSGSVPLIGGNQGRPLVDSPLIWTKRDVANPIGTMFATTRNPAGTLYSVSTMAGANSSIDLGLYRTDDGLNWSEPVRVGSESQWMSNLSAGAEGRLYSVSTAAFTGPITPDSPGGDLVVSTSLDEGATWQQSLLPGIDLRQLRRQSSALQVQVGQSATSPDATIIPVWIFAEPKALELPDGVDDSYGSRRTVDGIEAYGTPTEDQLKIEADKLCPSGDSLVASAPDRMESPRRWTCSLRPTIDLGQVFEPTRLSWADVGLTDEQGQFARGRTLLFATSASVDGAFRMVELPRELSSRPVVSIQAIGSGFELIGGANFEDDDFVVYRSDDGLSWDRVGEPVKTARGSVLSGGFRGHTALIIEGSDRQLVVVSDPGLGAPVSLPMQRSPEGTILEPGNITASVFGNSGIALTVTSQVDLIAMGGGIHVDSGDFRYVQESSGRSPHIVDLATGEDLGAIWVPEPDPRIRFNPDGIGVVDSAGEVVADFPQKSIDQAIERLRSGQSQTLNEQVTSVMYSPDGADWSSVLAEEIVGEPVERVAGLAETPNGFAITVVLKRRSADDTPIRVVYEATLGDA